jgi:hypothetical protein
VGVGSRMVARAMLCEIFRQQFRAYAVIIDADGQIVGFSTVACDAASETEYWIDDIMIDRRFQGRGARAVSPALNAFDRK